METRKYKCCRCNAIFEGACHNWYAYYGERQFHCCPECDSKLVPAYDFDYIGTLNKITVGLFTISIVAWMIASYFWGWQFAGILAFGIPATVGGITHSMYWSALSNIEDEEVQETKIRPVKYDKQNLNDSGRIL